MKKKLVVLLSLVFMFVSLFASTTFAAEKSTLTIAWSENLSSMNPFLLRSEDDYAYMGYVFEPMCMVYKDGTVEPWLAKSWVYDEDAMTYTFTMDERAVWSDGVPLTAEDVKFTFDTSFAHDLYLGSAVKSVVDEITVVDDHTVVFKLNAPYPGFLVKAGGTLITPKHLLEGVEDITTYTNPDPVGSGPYVYSDYQQGSFIRLVKNEIYWQGAPAVDEVIFQDFGGPENSVMPFLAGEIDILPEMSGQETLIPSLASAPNSVVLQDQWPSVWYVAPNYRVYPLNVYEVRQAIDLAINKDELINIALSGYADAALMGYIPPVNVKWANFDCTWEGAGIDQENRIAMANEILDNLGYAVGNDGIRVADDGTRLSFSLMCLSQYPSYVRAAEMIKSYLEGIGIEIIVETKDAGTLFGEIVFNDNGGDKWDLLLHGSTIGTDPIDIENEWAPTSTSAWYNANAFGWDNAATKAVFDAAKTEMDETARIALVKEAQQMFADELVVITLGHRQHVAAYSTANFEGWNPANISYGSMIHPLLSIQNILSLVPKE
jgi:peptide/nickel transport system substrate-binding protein